MHYYLLSCHLADMGRTDAFSFACHFYMYAYPGRICLHRTEGITPATGGEGAFDEFLYRMLQSNTHSESRLADLQQWSDGIRNVTRF